MSEIHLELQKYLHKTVAELIMSYTLENYFRTLDEWYENRRGQYPRPALTSKDLCPKAGGAHRIIDLLVSEHGIETRRASIRDLLLREGSEFIPKHFTIEETSHGWWYRGGRSEITPFPK